MVGKGKIYCFKGGTVAGQREEYLPEKINISGSTDNPVLLEGR
jgi:hypothetical protein